MPGRGLRDVLQECTLIWITNMLACTYASFCHVIFSQAAAPAVVLRLSEDFKTLNGEGWASWSCLLSTPAFMCRIVLRSSLQGWCAVKLNRCEMWAQAVGEIHFLCLHRDDRETGRPSARLAVTNTRWQPQSEELASNDKVFWGGHRWWQRSKASVCSNYAKYLVSFSAW